MKANQKGLPKNVFREGAASQEDPTWQELILWLAGFDSGADKGNPHVLGCHIVLVGAAEDIDV